MVILADIPTAGTPVVLILAGTPTADKHSVDTARADMPEEGTPDRPDTLMGTNTGTDTAQITVSKPLCLCGSARTRLQWNRKIAP